MEAESALRELVTRILRAQLGEEWLGNAGLPEERLLVLEARQTVESKKRRGQRPEQDLLSYSDVSDLRRIIVKNWQLFSPALNDRKTFDVFIDRLEALRNPDAHHRALWPYEVNLLLGISGYFRQLVAASRTIEDKLDQFYPRFESVTDNFGNVCTWPERYKRTDQVVRSGDELSFQIAAWTPRPEPLEFIASVGLLLGDNQWTTSNVLTLRLTDADMTRNVSLYIRLRQPGMPQVSESLSFDYVGVP
jgi:hypothetical protein